MSTSVTPSGKRAEIPISVNVQYDNSGVKGSSSRQGEGVHNITYVSLDAAGENLQQSDAENFLLRGSTGSSQPIVRERRMFGRT